MTTVKASAAPRAGSSGNMAVYWVKIAAMTTVMGPVGPETWAGVPPKRAAKKPTKMAP